MNITIDGEKHEVWLDKTPDGGIDFCIADYRQHCYIVRLTTDGELVLYRDVASFLKQSGEYYTIKTKDEFDAQ